MIVIGADGETSRVNNVCACGEGGGVGRGSGIAANDSFSRFVGGKEGDGAVSMDMTGEMLRM